jgi:hypothetical protein
MGENVPNKDKEDTYTRVQEKREDFERKIGSLPMSLWSNWSKEYLKPNLSREGHKLMLSRIRN